MIKCIVKARLIITENIVKQNKKTTFQNLNICKSTFSNMAGSRHLEFKKKKTRGLLVHTADFDSGGSG